MRKIVLIVFIFFLSFFNKAYCAISVANNGSTIVNPPLVTQNIIVTMSGLTLGVGTTLTVTALDAYVTNTSMPSVQIPVSGVYLNNGTTSYQLVYNTAVTLINGLVLSLTTFQQPYAANIPNAGNLPPGTYVVNLRFRLTQLLILNNTVDFQLQFTIPVNQTVSTTTNPVNIIFTTADVFNPSASVVNAVTPRVNLFSNTSWTAILDTTGIGTLKGNYYYQIINTTSGVNPVTTAKIQIQPNMQYTLATGAATVTQPVGGVSTNQYMDIQYSCQNASGQFMPEGSFTNYVKYIIQ